MINLICVILFFVNHYSYIVCFFCRLEEESDYLKSENQNNSEMVSQREIEKESLMSEIQKLQRYICWNNICTFYLMYQINHACHFEILFRGETL